MAQISADPEKLKQLARQFRTTSEQCRQIARQLQHGLDRADWRDAERQRFEESLKDTLRTLQRVADQLDRTFPAELERKAAALEQFRS